MIVSCESCGAQYRVREEKLPPQGGKIQCPTCNHVFVVRPPSTPMSRPGSAILNPAPSPVQREITRPSPLSKSIAQDNLNRPVSQELGGNIDISKHLLNQMDIGGLGEGFDDPLAGFDDPLTDPAAAAGPQPPAAQTPPHSAATPGPNTTGSSSTALVPTDLANIPGDDFRTMKLRVQGMTYNFHTKDSLQQWLRDRDNLAEAEIAQRGGEWKPLTAAPDVLTEDLRNKLNNKKETIARPATGNLGSFDDEPDAAAQINALKRATQTNLSAITPDALNDARASRRSKTTSRPSVAKRTSAPNAPKRRRPQKARTQPLITGRVQRQLIALGAILLFTIAAQALGWINLGVIIPALKDAPEPPLTGRADGDTANAKTKNPENKEKPKKSSPFGGPALNKGQVPALNSDGDPKQAPRVRPPGWKKTTTSTTTVGTIPLEPEATQSPEEIAAEKRAEGDRAARDLRDALDKAKQLKGDKRQEKLSELLVDVDVALDKHRDEGGHLKLFEVKRDLLRASRNRRERKKVETLIKAFKKKTEASSGGE